MIFERIYSPAITGAYFAGLISEMQVGSTWISEFRSGPEKNTTDSRWVGPLTSRGGLTAKSLAMLTP